MASLGVGLESTSEETGGILACKDDFEAPSQAQMVKKLFISLYIWGTISVEKSTGITTPQEIKKTSKTFYAILLTKMYLVHVAIVPVNSPRSPAFLD